MKTIKEKIKDLKVGDKVVIYEQYSERKREK
jgi:ubiquitin